MKNKSESDYSFLLNEIERFISDLNSQSIAALPYHNLEHTKSVVEATHKIAAHFGLDASNYFIVSAAAWFHDIGYLNGKKDHERTSANAANEFLKARNVDNKIVESINDCIMATGLGTQPSNTLQKIIKDADTFHLGTDQFYQNYKLLRKELKGSGLEISKEEWRNQTIQFLTMHRYYTDYCQKELESHKQANLEMLQLETSADGQRIYGSTGLKDKIEKKKKKPDKRDRGIDTMFKLTSTNSQRLSDQADHKANILITVNSIIISVLLGTVVRRLDDMDNLTIPSVILLIVSLTTITFAILATVPRVPRGLFTQEDIDKKRVNLLFFGNFYQMKFDDYAKGMFQIMNDGDFLYLSLIRDVYSQGIVLGRKYKLLKAAYYIFLVGLVLSVVSFFIASKYYGK